MKSFFALLLASASVYAAAPNVGLVDPQEVFVKYAKAVELQAELAKSRDAARAAIGEREKVLLQLQTELQSIEKRGQDPMLSENGKKTVAAEFQQKNATFQQRLSERQNFINEAQGAIQQRLGEMNKQIIADIRTASEKIAKANRNAKGFVVDFAAHVDRVEGVVQSLHQAKPGEVQTPMGLSSRLDAEVERLDQNPRLK